MVETLWRCVTCRKWSHAKRRPKRHQRWVHEGDPEYDESRNENSGLWASGGDMALGAHTVDCGPFEKWQARRVPEGPLVTVHATHVELHDG